LEGRWRYCILHSMQSLGYLTRQEVLPGTRRYRLDLRMSPSELRLSLYRQISILKNRFLWWELRSRELFQKLKHKDKHSPFVYSRDSSRLRSSHRKKNRNFVRKKTNLESVLGACRSARLIPQAQQQLLPDTLHRRQHLQFLEQL